MAEKKEKKMMSEARNWLRNNVFSESVLQYMSGSLLTANFFRRNLPMIIAVVVLMFAYISNRYTCIAQIAQIKKLEAELKDAKYEYQVISARLMGLGRQSQVQRLVDQNELELELSDQPVYSISENEENGND